MIGFVSRRASAALLALLAVAACGQDGVAAPAQVQGKWGADCSEPFVAFAGGTMHVGPDKADYTLSAATLTGNDLKVGYKSAQGEVVEHYVVDGATLRLDRGTYGGQEATWHKAPMHRCR